MIYITQLVYIKQGQENVFHRFEELVIPAIARYNGRLLLRVRPAAGSFIESNIEQPYEIHLVEFNSEEDFGRFRNGPERQLFLHLKEQSVKASILIQGTLI